jgi:uroporphyrinogen-III decarboxylase
MDIIILYGGWFIQKESTHWYGLASHDLLDILTNIVIEYMSLQIENGAHMLQLFEVKISNVTYNYFMKITIQYTNRCSLND